MNKTLITIAIIQLLGVEGIRMKGQLNFDRIQQAQKYALGQAGATTTGAITAATTVAAPATPAVAPATPTLA